MACFCEGLWTEDRALRAGYITPGLCPLCQAPDSVGHMIFACQHAEVVAARLAADVSTAFLERAQSGDA
eukprot:7940025-Pyramimonas_sp.AAC.1